MIPKIIKATYLHAPESLKFLIRNFVWRFHLTEQSKKLFKFYSSFIKRGDLVFDIGANYGNHSAIFAELGAKVVSVEPNPALIYLLKKRFKGRIKIVNKGISSKEGILEFNFLKDTGKSTFDKSTIQKGEDPVRIILIRTITLNNLINTYGIPKFIKIDVEGFEYEVLQTLKRPVKCLSFEFKPKRKETVGKCLSHLESIGYKKFNFSYNSNFKLELSDWKKSISSSVPNRTGDIYVKI